MTNENTTKQDNNKIQDPIRVLGGTDSLDAIRKVLGVDEIKGGESDE